MWCPVDWVPEDHSFSVRSLWNRSWWQGVSVERNWREGLKKKKIPFLFLIGGGVLGVQPLISSKCCSRAQKRDCNLEKYLGPHSLHHSPLREEKEFEGTFNELFKVKPGKSLSPCNFPSQRRYDSSLQWRPGRAPPIYLTPHSRGAVSLWSLWARTATSWFNIYCCHCGLKVQFEPSPQQARGSWLSWFQGKQANR